MKLEPIAAIGIVAFAVIYGAGIHRLSLKGRRWPWRRTVPFIAGLILVAAATESPLAAEDTKLFSLHVMQHLILAMAAPICLCLGAPITLWLQAASRPVQTKLLAILHSRFIRFITFPVVSWCAFVGTLFVLYFTGLYQLSLENTWFHELVHIHFLIVGFLFFAPVVAIDPHPWRLPHGARLLYVALTLPAHAFLALALLSASTPLASHFYLETTGHNLGQLLRDQKLGAAVMWVAGDLLAILTVGVVAIQWATDDERVAAREDRELDRGRGTPALAPKPAAPVKTSSRFN